MFHLSYFTVRMDYERMFYTQSKYILVREAMSCDLKGGFKENTYLQLKIVSSSGDGKRLLVTLAGVGGLESDLLYQENIGLEISHIAFKNLDYSKIFPYLLPKVVNTTYAKDPFFNPLGKKTTLEEEGWIKKKVAPPVAEPLPKPHPPVVKSVPKPQIIEEIIQVPWHKLTYLDGRVEYDPIIKHKRGQFRGTVRIYNKFIEESFGAITPAISKILGSKLVTIQYRVRLDGFFNCEVLSCSSPQIEAIDEKVVGGIYFKSQNEARRKLAFSGKGQLTIPVAELFGKGKSSSSYSPEETLEKLNTLFTEDLSLHYKQLQYLSSKHKSSRFHLRKVPFPEVAFLFLLEGEKKYHFVNETYNTKAATYIWSCEKGKEREFFTTVVSNALSLMKDNNRMEYRTNIKNEPHKHTFSILNHNYDPEKGFEQWKEEIEKILV